MHETESLLLLASGCFRREGLTDYDLHDDRHADVQIASVHADSAGSSKTYSSNSNTEQDSHSSNTARTDIDYMPL